MPTNEELADQGMAIFRSIVTRSDRGICVRRIAQDRYCPAPTVSERGLYCEKHRQEAEVDHQRLVRQGWENLEDDTDN